MLWVLWDIVLPLVATFLLGLFIGWLLWRWRRSRIDANDLSKLRRSSARNRADVERLQQSNNELSDRLQAANGAGGGDLASARKRIDMLADELKSSRREVAELKASNRAGGSASAASTQPANVNELKDLQLKLQQSRSRVTELENSTRRSESGSAANNQTINDLRREIEARDRMIATLQESLNQFGESGDTTALMADIALRDRKIVELEAAVATLQRS